MINDKGEEVGIIYGWYNTKSEKWYIGQTIRPLERFKEHIDAAINKKDKTYFYNSIRKYGLENFVYCVLEENVLRENLNMREIDWIEYYDSFYCGYNMTAGGNQTIFSEEFKRKLSESHKGNPGYWTNKHLSEETKKKLSESHKGKTSPNRKKVSQYDLNGNYIQTYNSVTDAMKYNPKAGNLTDVCRGKRKQAGGFIWKYAS